MLARTVAAALAALLIAGCGITGNFRHDPGYAAFGEPGPLAEDRELGISLGPLPLAFARLVLDDDPEVGPILKDLRAVRVYSYGATRDAEEHRATRTGDSVPPARRRLDCPDHGQRTGRGNGRTTAPRQRRPQSRVGRDRAGRTGGRAREPDRQRASRPIRRLHGRARRRHAGDRNRSPDVSRARSVAAQYGFAIGSSSAGNSVMIFAPSA